MSEQRSRVESEERREEPAEEGRRESLLKLLGGRTSSAIGVLFAVGGIVASVRGLVGYYLGSRRLGDAAIVLGVVAVFVAAAVSTDLIPGIPAPGHGYNG